MPSTTRPVVANVDSPCRTRLVAWAKRSWSRPLGCRTRTTRTAASARTLRKLTTEWAALQLVSVCMGIHRINGEGTVKHETEGLADR